MKTKLEKRELYQELVQKAWESITFKEQLVSNPEATIAEVLGVEAKGNSNIVVEDQTDSSIIYLNIPKNITPDDITLTDEELELVSGGDWMTAMAIAGGIAAGAQLIDWFTEGVGQGYAEGKN
ncbi:hypothetical protein PG911_00605 [Tenacibaculum ovolyticum]|uniref:hypothetical protein n=1 Tax=Tenacibaculum ovolyticum TaxID=104270 RepID=UPI0022F3FB9E|nr:hypothetical protein [Tenacibaculum ovolyticum]WBX76792.1 hypothetical protein PG911_00605 [Tenacibaculum ovolyticum]